MTPTPRNKKVKFCYCHKSLTFYIGTGLKQKSASEIYGLKLYENIPRRKKIVAWVLLSINNFRDKLRMREGTQWSITLGCKPS